MPKRKANSAIADVHAAAAVNAATGVGSVVSALRELAPASKYSLSWQKKLAAAEVYKVANAITAYGEVCCTSKVQGKSGELEIYHVNPFALLEHAASISLFSEFLAKLVASDPDHMLDIVYYLDKATPGNDKRPDHGRSCQCVYFTFLQFPAWFRSRRNGWIPFTYILVEDQKEATLTDPMLVRFLVRTFDCPDAELAFSKGICVRGHAGIISCERGGS